jgi:methylmalonyl-CoA/ethylmalonyl-CoA epimerase
MAYRVDDIDEVSEHLRAQGMRLLYDAPKKGTAGAG